MKFLLAFLLLISSSSLLYAENTKPQRMNNDRLGKLIHQIDENAKGSAGNWTLTYEGYSLRIITDEKADRMRIILGVTRAEDLKPNELYRLLQANFDTSLDARYSIAKGIVWSAFIHPLSPLSDNEFLSGLAQTINLTSSYGSSFSSGALHFLGGDHAAGKAEEKRYRELMKKGQLI
jgi:hypothetical protein